MQELHLFLIPIWAMINRWLYTRFALVSYQHLGHDYQVVIQHTRVLHLFLIPIWTLIIMWLYPSIVLVSNPQMGLAYQVLICKYCACFLSTNGVRWCLFLMHRCMALLIRCLYVSIALVSYQHLGHNYQVVIHQYCPCFLSPFGP